MADSDEAFADMHRHYGRHVEAYVARRVPDDAVDDVVSEVFMTAWRRRADIPFDGLPWLYGCARNVVGTWYRGEQRWRALKARLAEVPHEASPIGGTGDVVAARERLVHALGLVGEDDRETLLLVAWEGLTPAELGQVFGISAGAASVRVHRARTRLRAAMTEHDKDVESDR